VGASSLWHHAPVSLKTWTSAAQNEGGWGDTPPPWEEIRCGSGAEASPKSGYQLEGRSSVET
jgi:hypothetical protein